MNLEEFRQDIRDEVEASRIEFGDSPDAVFCRKISEMLRETSYLPDEEINSVFFQGTTYSRRKKMRVDGYLHDLADNSLYLFIVDYEIEDTTMTKTKASGCFSQVCAFANEVITNKDLDVDFSRPEAALIDLIKIEHAKENIHKYKLILLTNSIRSKTLIKIDNMHVGDIEAECQLWDIERIYEAFFSTQSREAIKINFLDYTEQGLPCIEAGSDPNRMYESYLCVIPGKVLADVYDKYGSRLLEGNVRSFLSTKGSVNKKIRSTIMNEPEMFLAYNNGVAATAKDVQFAKTDSGLKLTSVEDIQIINGGQTTASLSNTRFKDKADLNKVFVQMKLTKIGDMDQKSSEELIHNISRSSNSQNKVSEADFFATHPFHIEMEQISRRKKAPAVNGAQIQTTWYYERARGQYTQEQMRMTKAQRNAFERQNPKSQMMTKTDFAKFRMSWAGHPDIVSKGAQTNFMEYAKIISDKWESNKDVFNELYFQETVALAIMFKTLEKQISKETWYDSYRANIVTYSMALLHYKLNQKYSGMELDLIKIWNNQALPKTLINIFRDITHKVNDYITDDSRQVQNVTQWCKRAACWEGMKKTLEVELPDDLSEIFQSKLEKKKLEKAAQKDQSFVSKMEALGEVTKISGDTWKKVRKDALDCGLLKSDKLLKALKSAEKMPISIPTENQAELLVKLLNELHDEGKNYERIE